MTNDYRKTMDDALTMNGALTRGDTIRGRDGSVTRPRVRLALSRRRQVRMPMPITL